MNQPTEPDERTARLTALQAALIDHQFNADMAGPFRLRVSSQRTPGIEVSVTCRRRRRRLWFLGRDKRPLAPADNITKAIKALKKQTSAYL
jgi:hypothetical protein